MEINLNVKKMLFKKPKTISERLNEIEGLLKIERMKKEMREFEKKRKEELKKKVEEYKKLKKENSKIAPLISFSSKIIKNIKPSIKSINKPKIKKQSYYKDLEKIRILRERERKKREQVYNRLREKRKKDPYAWW
ncbi:MAG: hypothetical protein NC935_02150 [Candidatus Omnitrophica bacterium]|nr:hypothetical protein [Candidatus Omnitrophota bacterium]